MDIYLIRHTQPAIAKGICYGQSDLKLAETFPLEAEKAEKQLSKLKSDFMLFSSPLQRCSKLAETIFPISARIDNRLMELDFGDWEMKTWDDIPQTELNPWMEDFVHMPCPNGESYMDLYLRCIDFLEELKQQNTEQAFVITHAGPIRAMHAYVNDIELKDSFSLKVGYGEFIKIEL